MIRIDGFWQINAAFDFMEVFWKVCDGELRLVVCWGYRYCGEVCWVVLERTETMVCNCSHEKYCRHCRGGGHVVMSAYHSLQFIDSRAWSTLEGFLRFNCSYRWELKRWTTIMYADSYLASFDCMTPRIPEPELLVRHVQKSTFKLISEINNLNLQTMPCPLSTPSSDLKT